MNKLQDKQYGLIGPKRVHRFMNQLQMMWAIAKKDLSTWIRSPVTIIVTIAPALILIVILVSEAAATSGYPVAIVNNDNRGIAAQKFVQTAMDYDGFYNPKLMIPQQAAMAYGKLQVAGILTIPANFSADITAKKKPVIEWQLRNFSADCGNDLGRALPDIVYTFLKSGAAGPNMIHTTIDEQDIHKTDASVVGFNLLAIIVVLILQSGIVNAGLASVREWEQKTVKELIMSPASSLTVIAGKVLAGVITSDIAGCIALGLSLILGIVSNVSLIYMCLALIMMTLLGVFGSGLGVISAAMLKSADRVGASSTFISFFLFFLAGGISEISYLPNWLRTIGHFIPNTYAISGLRNMLLYNSSAGLGKDFIILGLSSIIVLAIGVPLLRRGLEN
jgi:ABC-type multidrug transport system permease subunit